LRGARELAIRLALVRAIGDLARQLTLESLLLSVTGGALGVVAASWMLRTFVVLAGTQLPRAATIAIDARVLAFSAAITIATGALCGLWPLARLRLSQLASAVREGDSVPAAGRAGASAACWSVAEIAMAFALLAGAGLL
jgi:putative ABC transport system permease protein